MRRAAMDKAFAERPTLRAWLEEYAAIEREFVAAMAAEGRFSHRAPLGARVPTSCGKPCASGVRAS